MKRKSQILKQTRSILVFDSPQFVATRLLSAAETDPVPAFPPLNLSCVIVLAFLMWSLWLVVGEEWWWWEKVSLSGLMSCDVTSSLGCLTNPLSAFISRCLFSLTHGSVLCKEPEENRFKALMLVVGNVWFTAAAEVGEVTLMFRCRTGSLTSLNTCWAPVRCRCSDSFLWSSFKSACALSSSPAAPSPACRSI